MGQGWGKSLAHSRIVLQRSCLGRGAVGMRTINSLRLNAVSIALATAALTVAPLFSVQAFGVAASGLSNSDPETGNCMPLEVDNPLVGSGEGRFTDNNPTVYVGGDARFENHEGEGLVVVEGNLDISLPQFAQDRQMYYHLGADTGGGSGSWPAAGALMLAVKGELSATYNSDNSPAGVYVGNNTRPGKWYAGSVADGNIWHTDNQITDLSGTVVDGYRDRLNNLDDLIDTFPATGTTSTVGNHLLLEGDDISGIQVFDIDFDTYGELLRTPGTTLDFMNIPTDASIFLNVPSEGPLQISGELDYTLNGTAVVMPGSDWAGAYLPDWGNLTQRLMWRFPGSGAVTLGADTETLWGFTGSVFAAGDVDTHVSVNGRLIAFGDLLIREGEPGDPEQAPYPNKTEFHSFPFDFQLLQCQPADNGGSFIVSKAISGATSADFPAGTEFSVIATITEPGQASYTEELLLPADGTPIASTHTQLPAGSIVSFAENPSPAPSGYTTGEVSFSPSSGEILIGENIFSEVTVTNTYTRTNTGGFSIEKILNDPANLAGENSTYTVLYRVDGGTPTALTLSPGEAQIVDALPVGAVVTFEELAASPIPGGSWETPQISPQEITITGAAPASTLVTVTNVLTPVNEESGSFSLTKDIEGTASAAQSHDFVVQIGSHAPQEVAVSSGETLYFSNIPLGTEVSIQEVQPGVLPGYEWNSVRYEKNGVPVGNTDQRVQFTIEGTERVSILAVNAYELPPTQVPSQPDQPTSNAPKSPPKLAVTGAAAIFAAAIAGIVLASGSLVFFTSRRARTK